MKMYLVREAKGRHVNNRPAYEVRMYRDPEGTDHLCTWPVFRSDAPRPSDKHVMYNCARYETAWPKETKR
jgi:hypothetical protein